MTYFADKTFCLLGEGKTGTHTLWNLLKNHPQIYVSNIKSSMRFTQEPPTLEKYIELNWNRVKDEIVLVEGTASWWADEYPKISWWKAANKIEFKKIVCIYTVRLPYIEFFESKLRSYYNCLTEYPTDFIKNNCINEDSFLEYIKRGIFKRIRIKVEKYIRPENILIINLSKISEFQKRIYKFLEVSESYLFEVGFYNQGVYTQHKDTTNNIKSFLNKHKSLIKEVENSDIEKIKENYPNVFGL